MMRKSKKEKQENRYEGMTRLELFEEFERIQRKKEAALKVQIIAATGSVICSIIVFIVYCCC